jgi:NTE family protein
MANSESRKGLFAAMVQRGYDASISVLSGLWEAFSHAHLARYVGTACAERLTHRLLTVLRGTLYSVTPDLYSRFKFMEKPKLPTGIGLALGGGFARGYAHLGVLQVFEEQQIPICCISGSSIGSILGAAYASGSPLGQIVGQCREIRFRDFARWRVSRYGLASNDRLEHLLQRCFDSRQFEHLKIPTVVVATDLDTGDPVVFSQGRLAEAIRASCAFPGLFEPVQIGTRHLADGGLVAPVPTRAARELGAEIVVGVSVGLHDGRRGAPNNIFQVVSRAVSAAQKNQLEVWERHADLVLRPSVQSIAWDDFGRIDEAMEAGASAARHALPQIKKLLAVQAESEREPGKQGEYLIAESLK